MHRTPFVLTATVAGLAGVLTYHAHTKPFGAFNPAAASGLTPPHRARPHQSQSSSGAAAPLVPTPLLSRRGTGALVTYGYGELAVRVSISGGKITDVNITQLRTAEQYSQSLAQQVLPTLRSEVLQAQSANINGVSGATYTSEAFAMSLQSALKHLGV
jgi:FMN-binding domain